MAEDLYRYIQALLSKRPDLEGDPETVGALENVRRILIDRGINSLGDTQKDEIDRIARQIEIQNSVLEFFAENAPAGNVEPENYLEILQKFNASVVAPLSTAESSDVPISWFLIPSQKSVNPTNTELLNKIGGIDERFRGRYNRHINGYVNHAQHPPINFERPTLREFQSTSESELRNISNMGPDAVKYLTTAFQSPRV